MAESEEYYLKMITLLESQLDATNKRLSDSEKQAAAEREKMSQQMDRLLELAGSQPPADVQAAPIVPSTSGKKMMPIVQSTGRYKEADFDILFDHVTKRVEAHIKKEMLTSNTEALTAMGRGLDVVSLFGNSHLRSIFCVTYLTQLRLSLRLNKDYMADKSPLLTDTMKTNHKKITRNIKKRCKDYGKRTDMAKIAESIDYKGLRGLVDDQLDATCKSLSRKSKSGQIRTEDDNTKKASLIQREKSLRLIAGRATQYYATCGEFLMYIEIMGIPIVAVDAHVFVDFQDYINANKPLKTATLNNRRRDIMKFFKELATADPTGQSFMPAIPYADEGSIPRRKTEIGTAPPPPEVYWVELDERRRLRKTRDDIRDIYKCIRVDEVGNDPELLEICVRFLRETGLRPAFARLVQFGDFSKKPVKRVGKTKTPVYHFSLKDVKRFETGNKGIATYNMFISELLWNQINTYRNDPRNADIYDQACLFSGVKLLGKPDDEYEIPVADITHDILTPLGEAYGKRIKADKIRDSYYTLMLTTLNVKDVDAFKDWTGDTRTTAENNYRGVAESVDVPEPFLGANASYAEIVAAIFNKEEPAYVDGDLANPKICSDGTVIYRRMYRDGKWVDSGQRC